MTKDLLKTFLGSRGGPLHRQKSLHNPSLKEQQVIQPLPCCKMCKSIKEILLLLQVRIVDVVKESAAAVQHFDMVEKAKSLPPELSLLGMKVLLDMLHGKAKCEAGSHCLLSCWYLSRKPIYSWHWSSCRHRMSQSESHAQDIGGTIKIGDRPKQLERKLFRRHQNQSLSFWRLLNS